MPEKKRLLTFLKEFADRRISKERSDKIKKVNVVILIIKEVAIFRQHIVTRALNAFHYPACQMQTLNLTTTFIC
ncbi:MAG: hypothetical protein GWP19_08935 [Planctomycetia bacterium]|nr:hypothetical protein [Planctomycetia bacterium]